jgi:hypothetical protein
MPVIYCAISGHGFGHAAQTIPLLNELGRRRAGLKALLRTNIPATFFEGRLTVEWEMSPAATDVGCIQRGPLTIDIGETWRAHRRFHEDWEARVEAEARLIAARAPALVLANIPPLAVEAAARAGVPAVGSCSISWDGVLAPWMDEAPDTAEADGGHATRQALLSRMQRAYGLADLMIRPAPGTAMTAFRRVADVGPIARSLAPERERLRRAVGARAGERLVVVGFGGIPPERLPSEALEAMAGYRFIISGPVPSGATRLHRAEATGLPFGAVMASADILVTKPGYSTVVEAVAQGLRVLYVRRHTFVDELPLVDYLHRYGLGLELSAEDFAAGRWRAGLDALLTMPPPAESPPAPTGAAEAAALLASYL